MQATINGIDVHYRFDGPEGAPVLTLSNSLASNLAMWEPQMDMLTRRFRVLRYDQRGHGGTAGTTGPYSFDMLAADAQALLQALGIARTHWMGLSMGGMTAMGLWQRAPELIASFVLADTASEMSDAYRTVCDERIALAESKGMEAHVDGTIARWFTAPFVARNPAELNPVRAAIRTTSVAGYVGVCHALKSLNYTAVLSSIRVPTLVIVGRDDPSTPVAAAEDIQRRIAGARLVVIDEASHIANIEQPAAFNAALEAFYGSLPK